uniref:Uncharacterized protein n=1 Tax=Candidatus Kentrum eta TaxID=2126337 RepID=A0A450VIL8_9GAMM|nr:MAG: hypothetical protein BECKH772B_GA0070898_104623 [Candidatus Kentron sp. H]VFK05432.1 MAG: hypothetical protein BECKH772A_GA0070896_105482 [Candidatus Kentron sp. H]VFK07883.1 MAG: hypothetical protein BECKH772C_GA0070978_104623 [Candidatus Kentron sp. H]
MIRAGYPVIQCNAGRGCYCYFCYSRYCPGCPARIVQMFRKAPAFLQGTPGIFRSHFVRNFFQIHYFLICYEPHTIGQSI